MKLESIKQKDEVKYPTISDVSNNKNEYGKGIMLATVATDLPVLYVAVPSYVEATPAIVVITSSVFRLSVGVTIISIILLIINKIKSSKDDQKEIKRKRRMKVYLGILIASSIIAVMTFIILVYHSVKVI